MILLYFCFVFIISLKSKKVEKKDIFTKESEEKKERKMCRAWWMFILMPCHMCGWAGKVMYDTLVGTIYQLTDEEDVSPSRTWFKFLSNLPPWIKFESKYIWDKHICERKNVAIKHIVWQIELKALTSSIYHTLNSLSLSNAKFPLGSLKFYFDLSRELLMMSELRVCFDCLICFDSPFFVFFFFFFKL